MVARDLSFLVLGLIVALSSSAAGQTTASGPTKKDPPAITLRLSSIVVSEYVGYLGPLLSEEPSVQTDTTLATRFGLSGGAWWSTGTDDRMMQSNAADQIDVFVAGSVDVLGLTLGVELRYQDFIPLDRSDGDAFIPRVRVSRKFALSDANTLTLSMQVEDRLTLPKYDERWTGLLAAQDIQKVNDSLALVLGVSALWDEGNARFDRGIIVQTNMGLRVTIAEGLTLDAFVRTFRPIGVTDTREEQALFGAGIAYTF